MRDEAKAGDSSVEQNLSESYKSGKEAESGFSSQIGEKEKAEIEKSNKDIETLKANFLKGHKYIESILFLNYNCLETAFTILPALMHRVQTLILLIVPSTFAFTLCKFGLNFLFVLPVILSPTPPFLFGKPLRSYLYPTAVFLPQISQIRAIYKFPLYKG